MNLNRVLIKPVENLAVRLSLFIRTSIDLGGERQLFVGSIVLGRLPARIRIFIHDGLDFGLQPVPRIGFLVAAEAPLEERWLPVEVVLLLLIFFNSLLIILEQVCKSKILIRACRLLYGALIFIAEKRRRCRQLGFLVELLLSQLLVLRNAVHQL